MKKIWKQEPKGENAKILIILSKNAFSFGLYKIYNSAVQSVQYLIILLKVLSESAALYVKGPYDDTTY